MLLTFERIIKKSTMTTIERSIVIAAAQSEVWDKLADLGAIQDFNPGVKKSFYNTDIETGEGAGRICEFHGAGIVNEKAIQWEEGKSFTLKILPVEKIPMFKSGEAHFTLTRIERDKTKVYVRFDYHVGAGPIGALMNAVAMKGQFAKGFEGILMGLKRHIEEGVLIDTVKDLKGYDVSVAVS